MRPLKQEGNRVVWEIKRGEWESGESAAWAPVESETVTLSPEEVREVVWEPARVGDVEAGIPDPDSPRRVHDGRSATVVPARRALEEPVPEWAAPGHPPADGQPTWLDAFPWLKGVETPVHGAWWDDSVDSPGALREARLARISDLAMQRLGSWSISQICPGLASHVHFLDFGLPVRATNAMQREGVLATDDLLSLTPSEVLDWRNVGALTIDTTIRRLAELSIESAAPAGRAGLSLLPGAPSSPAPAPSSPVPDSVATIIDDLSTIARWFSTIGLADRPVLGAPLPLAAPTQVTLARQRIEAVLASDLQTEAAPDHAVADYLDGELSLFGARAVQVLRERVFADDPATLGELGNEFGVTPERVRQIEGRARAELFGVIAGEGALADVAEAVRSLIGTILPLQDLLGQIPALAEVVEQVAQPAWRVLDRLDDAYEIVDGWCVAPTMAAAESVTSSLLQELADSSGVVHLSDIQLIEAQDPERLRELTISWLVRCGYVIQGDSVLTRTLSIGDYAAAILAAEGNPLSAQEILDRFVVERARSSLTNALASDDRFERVDRDRWALKEWGLDAYEGLRSVIRAELARHGGRMLLDDLVETITSKYTVTASSVTAYAAMVPFETRAGTVRLRTDTREPRKGPERTRRLFRRSTAWVFRVTITADHLRGSGFSAPVGLASLCGLAEGETIRLPSRLGEQSFAWTGTQPQLGTIRRFLLDEDIAAGTEVFLVFGDDGRFDFEVVGELSGSPVSDALILIGADPTTDWQQARQALSSAIKLPESATVASIIAGYRDRGDSDIADLLIDEREHLAAGSVTTTPKQNADVDEILDLL